MCPVYPYSCPNCGEFDEVQKITENAYDKCPKCGSNEIKRLIAGNNSFSINGPGVYSPGMNSPKKEPTLKSNRRRIKYD